MMAAHFGLAAAVKAKCPDAPLWALMLGTQLLDVAFVPLLLTGHEGLEAVAGHGYGASLIHAFYTHSLVGTALVAIAVGLLAGRAWGRRAGLALGAVVASHWLLDLVVHRPDLPLLPGNALGLPLLGLGAWQVPALAMALELAIIAVGATLYARALLATTPPARRPLALAASAAMAVCLGLTLTLDALGVG